MWNALIAYDNEEKDSDPGSVSNASTYSDSGSNFSTPQHEYDTMTTPSPYNSPGPSAPPPPEGVSPSPHERTDGFSGGVANSTNGSARVSSVWSHHNIQPLMESSFGGCYQRTNKQGGKKNIRCFPSCRPEGHRDTGYCGDSVFLRLVTQGRTDKIFDDVVSFCEFRPMDAEDDPVLQLGALVPWAIIEKDVKDKKRPMNRLFLASAEQGAATTNNPGHHPSEDVVLQYNKERKGWHYSWCGGRHKKERHTLRFYAGRMVGDAFEVLFQVDSPSFSLYSGKRRLDLDGDVKEEEGLASNGAAVPPKQPLKKGRQSRANSSASSTGPPQGMDFLPQHQLATPHLPQAQQSHQLIGAPAPPPPHPRGGARARPAPPSHQRRGGQRPAPSPVPFPRAAKPFGKHSAPAAHTHARC
jgi:hypothetical protein